MNCNGQERREVNSQDFVGRWLNDAIKGGMERQLKSRRRELREQQMETIAGTVVAAIVATHLVVSVPQELSMDVGSISWLAVLAIVLIQACQTARNIHVVVYNRRQLKMLDDLVEAVPES